MAITPNPADVARDLDAGLAVVLPLPTPLPYAVAARSTAVVNEAKGRPAARQGVQTDGRDPDAFLASVAET